jgi:glutathione S-transferase
LSFEAVPAPTKTHRLPDGTDFYTINPLGYVPVLELDDGRRLREGPAIVQYIADQVPAKALAPANGTFERYKLQEWLTFIGTEIHKAYSPLFYPGTADEVKAGAIAQLRKRYAWVDGELANKTFLMGDVFSVADAYLFTVTNWAGFAKVDISDFKNLLAYYDRIRQRPAVVAAMRAEGLIK